jgi:hypothetical protein
LIKQQSFSPSDLSSNLITKHFKENHCYQEQPHRGQKQKDYTELAAMVNWLQRPAFDPRIIL